jgi:hypothetical protein
MCPMRFESGISRQLTMDSNSQPSPRLGDCHQARNGIIVVDHLLSEKASVTIYFYLIKYHRNNVLEVMLEKTSFLKKLLKNI